MVGNSQDPNLVSIGVTSGMAIAGSLARGRRDWIDPVTGRFSWFRMLSGLATAVLLAEIALWAGTSYGVLPVGIVALAGVLGYVGPAPVIDFLTNVVTNRFGGKNESGK